MAGFRFLPSSSEMLKSRTLARLRSSYSGDLNTNVQKHVRRLHGLLSSTKTSTDSLRPMRCFLLKRHTETVENIHCPTASRMAPSMKLIRIRMKSMAVQGSAPVAGSPIPLFDSLRCVRSDRGARIHPVRTVDARMHHDLHTLGHLFQLTCRAKQSVGQVRKALALLSTPAALVLMQ